MLLRGEWIDDIFKQEIPSGVVDGVNKEFTLSKFPHSEDGTIVFLNGVPLLFGSEFTMSNKVLTLVEAPVEGQRVFVWYVKGEL